MCLSPPLLVWSEHFLYHIKDHPSPVTPSLLQALSCIWFAQVDQQQQILGHYLQQVEWKSLEIPQTNLLGKKVHMQMPGTGKYQ